jgi:hypothetical protein
VYDLEADLDNDTADDRQRLLRHFGNGLLLPANATSLLLSSTVQQTWVGIICTPRTFLRPVLDSSVHSDSAKAELVTVVPAYSMSGISEACDLYRAWARSLQAMVFFADGGSGGNGGEARIYNN